METACSEQFHINSMPRKNFILYYIHSVIQEVLECYIQRYSCLWLGNDPFSKHVQVVVQPGVWDTQVELQVISDYF